MLLLILRYFIFHMIKRFLTFALSVGFFIWLPNAFADGSGVLSLDAPSHIRQTQNNHKDLLTLRVDNIQVRAGWEVTDADSVFTIKAESNAGVLQTVKTIVAPVIHVATIYVEDKFELLNPSYTNLTASAVITVEFKSGAADKLELKDAPRLTAVAGKALSLHTFAAEGGSGTNTYTLVGGDDADYFDLDKNSGVLSLQASAQAGVYTLTVEVKDDAGDTDKALATVEVSAALELAEVSSFTVIASMAMSLRIFIASGGIGTPTYTIVSGNEKEGFTLNAASGVLSLVADAKPDTYVLTVQVMDARANTADTVVTVGVSAVLSLADAQRLGGAQGTAISLHIFAAQGGIGARTYTLLTDDVEDYFSLGAESGVLSLLVSATMGTYTLSVEVRDSRGNVADALATVRVAFLFLADAPPLYAVVGREVSLHTFDAKGVIGTATYAITLDNDKDYFSLDAESGVLSVRANAAIGIYTLSVSVKDGHSDAEALAVALVEVRASLSLVAVPPLTVIAGGVAHTLAASGGIGTLTYTIAPSNEVGFAVDAASGVLSLSVNAKAGRHTLTLQVADARANTVQALATVEVPAVLVLSDAPSFTVIASVAMSLHTFIASGGIGIKTYTLVADDAGKYFSVDAASGVFSLLLNTPAKDYMLTVRVMDGRDNTADTVVTVEVSAALVLAAAPSFTVIASVGMNLHTFVASGGIGTPTYTIVSGNEGRDFTLNAASGVLSLSVNAKTGEYTLTVQVMDARNNAVQVVATVGVSAALELAEVSSFTVIASVGMNLHTFIASGGIGAPTYTILAGNEGRDFTLNAASGVLSLTVNAELGSHTLTVQVMDERDNTADTVVTVEVSAALVLAAAPSFTVIASVGMNLHTFVASGGIGTPTYTIVSGNEGRDFTLNAASGVLSLSVNAKTGEYTLTVQVMDARNNAVQVVATVGVSAALELAEVSSFTVIASVGMNLHTFIASGGIGAPTYTILAGNEGRDFTLNAASGVLSLSVNAEVGSHTLTVQVMDERANTAQAVATVEVSAVLSLAAAPSFTVIASVGMNLHTFIASGGIGTPTYTIVSGNEGRDFTLNAASGVLSLSVNAKTGEYTLTVQVMDERANTAQAVATVEVSAALALAAVPSFTVIASAAMNLYTLVANGGIGTPTYTIVAGNDDGQFTLNAASGVLSLVADAKPDNYVLRIQAMDARANTAQAMVTVGVSAVLSLADAQRLGGAQGIAISLHIFAAQGGIGARTYTLLTDDVEDYFSLGAESGVLSLLASVTVGTYTLSVEVRDSRGNVADALATVRVAFLFLADVPPLYAVVGREVSLHTFDAKGVVGTLTYTITAGDDKDYFSLDAESGVLSVGADAAIGVYTLLVSVKDSRSDAEALAVVEVRASLSLVAVPPLTVIAGRVAHTLAASGGIGDLTYVIVSGKDGFALDANGVLSLHADAGLGRHTLTLQVMDERKHTVQALATVEVSAVLVLSDAPSFTVIASVAMSLHTFIASGGLGIKTYTLVAGDAEKYFAVDAASGVFSLSLNTPAKDYMLTVRAMDARDNTVETVVMVGVSAVLALAATPSFTVIASVGMNLHTFIASGGIGAPTYTILAGNEGRDFTLNAGSGVLSLSVNAEVGSHTLTVQVMDERDNTADTVVTVEVSAALVLAAAPSFTVIASVGMSLHTFIASGGIGTPTYTILAGNEGRDFTLNAASGVLSLSVNAEVGSHTLTVQVMDARDNTVETVVTVGVSAVLALAAVPSFTVIASVGMNLHTFIASGGIGTPTYTIVAGNDDGQFTLNAASGVLSLSVNAELGSYTLTVQVMDGRDNTAQAVATVEVAAALVLAAAPSFTVIASVAMSLHTFIASGGIGTPTYTILAGNEGRDFTLNAASGVLSLSVNAEVGRYTLTVRVMDERSNTAQAVATVGVSAALTLAATPSFTVIASVAMSLHTFIAGGGIGRKTYTLAAGDERYFSVGADSGVLSLSMNAEAGEYTLTVRVMDEHHNSIAAVVMVGVSAVLALADAPLLRTLVGEAGNLHTFAATGGLGDKTYTIVAGNEDYFSLDRSSGVLSMEVTVSLGMYTLSVQVADAEGNVATALATVKVASLLLRDVMLYAIEGREVSLYTFEAGGGSGAKTYTIVAGNEDRHFTLAANSGVLSVQSDVSVGIYTLSMQVQDAGGDRAEALAVVAVEASLFLADAPSLGALTGITMSVHTFVASGGIGAKTYTLSAGEGQAYFTLNAASGVLSVANATVGVYTLSVTVSDSRGNSAQARGTVEVVGTLSLADAPPLEALARLSVEVTLHTFAAGGGYGAKRYVMIADESGYFAIDAASGELLLPSNSAMLAGAYTLRVGVSDGLTPPQRATAMAAVRITRSGIFVLGGDDSGYKNDVWLWSAGGKVWKQETASASWDARFRHQAVAYHGRLYVLGGGQDFYKTNTFKKGVWSSADGKNWVSESTPGWSERISHQAVEYQGRLYVMGGRRKLLVAGKFYLSIGQDVWSWANGESWREDAGADWPIRYSHQAVVHNGRLYVLGGRASHTIIRNDVWSWAEGENKWSFEGNAPWEARYEHQAVSHMGRLYVLGGQTDTGGPTNDVWSSLDGKNWRQETAAAAWSKRNGHQVVSRDGRLYLMGGYSGSDSNKKKEKDVWTSVDGKSWSLANPANAGWSARDHHQAVVFPPNLVLSGTSATIILTLQAGLEIYTVSAQYGGGQYTYSLPPEIEGFKIDESSGVLSADNQAQAGVHEITVRVEDEEGSHAETIINIELPVLALATVPPLTVIAGRVAHTLAASGGVGTHTYAMVPGNEVGFALDAASGVLSLSVNAKAGRHTLTLQVADARANTVQAVATVEVSAVLVLSEVPSFTVIASVAMSLHTFIASGGIGIKTYTLVAGDAGEYFAVDATSGVFSLSLNTPAKDYMLTVRAMDARDNTVETVVTVGVSAALELAAAPSFTVIASVGMNLHTFVASGGIGAPTYTILAGNEGKDFTLNATSGVLSLSVNAKTGEYTLTVQVMDGRANTADTVVTVEVSAALVLAESPSFTVIASVGMNLHTFIASGGIGTPTYTIVSGNEGGHFALDAASGVLSLTVDAAVGRYTLTVRVMDERDNAVQVVAMVGVSAVLALAESPSFTVIASVGMNLHTFVASGGIGTPTYTMVSGNEGKDFTLNAASGVLSLSVNAEVGSHTLTVQVMDERDNIAETVVTVEVSAALVLAAAPSFTVIASVGMNLHMFIASGGIGTPTYTIVSGNEGGYFALDAASGVLSLTVDAAVGRYTLTVRVMDERDNAVQVVAMVGVSAVLELAAAPSFTVITVGMNLHTFIASGGIGTPTYTILAGNEGRDFTLNAASGVLSLSMNAEVGSHTLTVQVMDERDNTAETVVTVEVAALILAAAPSFTVIASVAMSLHTFIVSGGIGLTYTILAGNEGRDFTLNAASGVLSLLMNAEVGRHTLTVQVMDERDNAAQVVVMVGVSAVLELAAVPSFTVIASVAMSLHTFIANGGIGTPTYTIVAGNDDGNFVLNAASGVLSLTVDAAVGSHTLTVQVMDARDNTAQAVATVDVSVALSLAEASLLEAVVGMTMSVHTFAASGGIGAKTYTLVADNGSGYFAINATSGVLSVVNAGLGVYTLSVQVSDSRGNRVQARATVQVAEVLSLADAPSLEALARLSVMVSLHTFVAGDGIGSKRYTIIADEAGYFALDAVSGELSLSSNSAMRAGAYALRVEVSDGLMPPQRATAAATVQIARNGIFVLGGNESDSSTNKLTNDVWWSVDGGSWRENTSNAGWPARELHQVVAYRGRMYLLGGVVATGQESTENKNDVWSSLDGKNWSLVKGSADWSARGGHQALVHKGRMYVLGRYDKSDVWSSADGKNWDLVTGSAGWSARGQYQAVAHNGRMYMTGGYNRSDVWSSADGSSWRFEGNAAWGPRHLHQAVSHAGRLYVLGGIQGDNSHMRRNDVWSSLDGRSWVEEQANDNAFWVNRDRHQALSRDGLLYVLGGNGGTNAGLRKDVWSSSDGKSWTQVTMAAGWGAREYHQALVFPPDLALSGTSETITLTVQAAIYTLSAQYGFGEYTYSLPLESEALGFDIDKSSGVLSADNQAQGGGYEITVRVDDEEGSHAESIINIELRVLALADAPPLSVIAGAESVSLHAFTAIYGIGAPTYNLVDDLGYFTLGDASGVLSVSANVTVGVYTVSVEVSDDSGKMATAVATVEVLPMLSLADAPPLTVMAGLALSLHTFAASGGIGVKAYTITAGNEAKYFTLNAASGVLSLRATAPEGFHTLTVQAADEDDNLAEAVATVDVSAALSLADASLLEAVVGMTMSVHTFAASGGIGAKTYTLSADNGVGYFAINATSGVLSVVNAGLGVYTLSVQVSDSRGNSVQARATVQVAEVLSLADAPPLEALARLSVMVSLHTFVAGDGIGSKRYTIIAAEAGYFALDAVSGELSLSSNSAMLAGAYALRVEVSDGLMPPQRATAAATVQIARNGIFVLGGNESDSSTNKLTNDVWWSADGGSWRENTSNAGWTARESHQVVAHRGRMYLMGGWEPGERNDVWSSLDGKNWSLVTGSAGWSARGLHQALVHNGRMYVLGGRVGPGDRGNRDNGDRNDVWSSLDGKNWSLVTGRADWPARRYLQALVHNGRMYVLGGYNRRDVWSSADGSSWSFEGYAAWGPRHLYQAVSHAGRLYVLGGIQGANNFSNRTNDVWSSLDGRSWVEEKVNNNAFWTKRDRYQALSRDGLLYVLGGNVGGNAKRLRKDVWSSADGKNWTEETSAAGWGAREYHQVLVFPPNLALSGTSETITLTVQAAIYTLSAQYGFGQYTYSLPLESEALGFDIDKSSGVLSADNQAQGGGYEITVRVEDEEGGHAESIINIELRVLALADAPPLSVIAGAESVSLHAFTAIYGIGAPTYNLVDDLGYFTLGDASGVLSVQANVTVGVYTVSVEVSDDSGKMATAVATVEAVPMPSLADAPPLTVMAGLALSLHTFAASGGIGVKAYTITAGNEAKYFTLNAASGVLSLRATAPEGFHTLTVQAADEYDNLVEAVATVDVSAALSLAEASLLEAVVGMTMSVHTFAASGGIGAKTYTLVADNGSGYFAINATSGVLSVVNGGLGVYTLSVQVSDSRGNSVQARATVQVAEVLSLADAPSLEALARLSVMVSLHTFVAGDGIGSKRYTIIADEAGYFALDAVSGELSLSSNSAMRAGAYALRVEVSDGLMPPQRATAAATVRIARNGIFVLGGNESDSSTNKLTNDVWWSVDGGSWRENTSNAGWPARELHQVVAHRGRMYLMGGLEPEPRNDVWSSLDGKNWSLVKGSAGWSARGGHQALVHNGRMYVLGGEDANGHRNDVWSSADGKNWDLVTGSAGWLARGQYQAVAHNGRMYMTGGYNRSDVWSSADGSSWRFEGNAAWGPRHLHQAVSHAGRLYVLGGIQGDNSHMRRNDVWSSLDGRSWEQEKASNNAFWVNRDRHQALSRDGLLYVLGGNVGGTNDSLRKDVWSSSDGKSWTQVTMAAGWEAREYHQALAFPPGLALSGTSEMITLTVQAAIYTLSAQYGFGEYTYSLPLESEALGFDIDKSSGVLSADNQAQGGGYEITVRVDDEESGHAESIINIELRVLALADAPPLSVIAGAEAMSLHAFTAIYGIGAPTYNLVDDLGYFTLGDASGVLSVQANVTVGVYTVSVEVSDDSGKMATAVATVEVLPMLSLADAPLLSVVAGKALSLHTFTAAGGSKAKTYNLVDESGFFTLGENSGILSVQAVSEVGIYTVSVEVSDSAGNQATAQATVGVTARLSLADASLMAVEKKAVSLHTFVASGGIGARTYTLSAGNGTGYFVLDAASGVLSLSASASAGAYTLTVGVKDERDNIATAVATVNISVGLSLADAPPLEALARLSVMVSLHTFVASDGIGSKRYTIIADESGYFALDAVSGELSLSSNSAMRAGAYALRVEVSDGLMPPQRATAVATVQIARNGIFVLGGNESDTEYNDMQNDVWWSVDGGSWRENTSNAGWTAREFHQVVAYRGRMYLLGGVVATGEKSTENRNDVWSSLDGKNWSLVKGSAGWTARGHHQALVHKGRMYVLGGGGKNDVWSSADGENWEEETGSADWTLGLYRAVAHNGRMYVTGGYGRSDVWSSADGSSWRFEGDAAWGPRHLHQAVSHAGRLYVLGGIQGTNSNKRRNDVWSSLDGRSWVEEQANDNAFWVNRDRHQALSRDGLLYVLGGNGGTNAGLRKDVWSSPDGKSWTQVTMAAGWEAREYHQALAFPPNLALSGTSETITLTVQAAIYTLSAQYGFGEYTYSLPLESEALGFDIDKSSGVLSADGNAAVGGHTLTVQVEDEEGSQAETVVQVEIVAASTAALSAGSSIISPPASGGGAGTLALAGGGLSLLIMTPPASSLARPRTPPQARGVRI